LIADGKSPAAIFTAPANGAASAGAVTFAIGTPTPDPGGSWFGDANRPAINMLAEVTVSGTTYLYPILNSGVNGSGWNVTISRPNPSDRSQNLGLDVTVPSGTQWRFYLRSMVSTASHTMEYAGSGTDYTALPENGGVAIEANESISRNGGKVWLTSTDQSGKFKVGDTFAVDQQTGFITIDPQGVAINVVSDLTPELGGDLDVLARNIYSSVGDIGIQDAFNTGVNLMLVRESSLTTAYPFVTQYDIGTDPNQVPLNGFLGTMAFQDSAGVNIGSASIGQIVGPVSIDLGTAAAPTINFTGDTNTGIYSPGADQFAISTGGTGRVFVDASGNVGIGTGSPSQLFHVNNASGPARFLLQASGTSNAELRLQQTSGLLQLGTNATNFYIADSAARDIDISINGAERIRLQSDGILRLTAGLKFPATAVASADPNTLDDYEEGTWTPVVSFGGASVGITGTFSGTYTKVGNVVNAMFRITFTSKGSSTGTMLVSGIPFNAGSDIQVISGFGYIHRLATTLPAGQLILQADATTLYPLFAGYASGNSVSLTNTDIANNTDLRGGIVFRV
jgi:hypothetical protein